ncbi:GtrA family protein [Nocardia thailandica]
MAVLEPPPTVLHIPTLITPWAPFPQAQVMTRPASDRARTAAAYLRGDRALPQLIRFALVGGTSNIAYVLLFFAVAGIGPLVANVVGSLVSTVIANELHRQLTFHATDRIGWFTAQWEGGGLALVGLGFTTAGLAGLETWAPTLGDTAQAAAILAITAAVGLMRFLALRGLFRLPNRAEQA